MLWWPFVRGDARPVQYAALKAEKGAATIAASPPAPDAVAAQEAERQLGRSGLWAICVRPAYPSTTAWLPILAISFCLGFLEAIATRPVAHVVGAANGSRTP